MRLMIDTNIFLDVLTQREPFCANRQQTVLKIRRPPDICVQHMLIGYRQYLYDVQDGTQCPIRQLRAVV
mgnify:CR=1 FL=1